MSKSSIHLHVVQDYLNGVDYPCDKQDLIEFAEDQDAPDYVLEILEQIPEREYQSAGDVTRGMGTMH